MKHPNFTYLYLSLATLTLLSCVHGNGRKQNREISSLVGNSRSASRLVETPVSDDFSIIVDNDRAFKFLGQYQQQASTAVKASSGNCDLTKRVCLIEKPGDEVGNCLTGSEPYARQIQTLMPDLPDKIRSMLCQVDTIFVVQNFNAIATAAVIYREGILQGAVVAISASALNNPSNISEQMTAKDQKQFGIIQGGQKPNSSFPSFKINLHTKMPLLAYVITHEVSHLYDFFFGATLDLDCVRRGISAGDCPIQTVGFSANRWADRETKDPSTQFQFDNLFCYYQCVTTGNFALNFIQDVYRKWVGSAFVTPYASTKAVEDFAESSTFYFLTPDHYNFRYSLRIGNESFDLVQRFKSAKFENVRTNLAQFYGDQ